jgi:hypothetical protein
MHSRFILASHEECRRHRSRIRVSIDILDSAHHEPPHRLESIRVGRDHDAAGLVVGQGGQGRLIPADLEGEGAIARDVDRDEVACGDVALDIAVVEEFWRSGSVVVHFSEMCWIPNDMHSSVRGEDSRHLHGHGMLRLGPRRIKVDSLN